MKQRILLLGLTAMLVWTSVAGAVVKFHEKGEATLSTTGIETIVIKNARGDVLVRPGSGDQVHLKAIKQARAKRESEAKDMARQTKVETHRENGQLTIEVIYPKKYTLRVSFWDFSSNRWPHVNVDLELEVPAGLALEVESSSGDLTTLDMSGIQRLETVSGDIEIRNASHGVRASTTSGDLFAFDVGPSQLRSVSGDLKVEGVRGALRINSTSGDITISEASDSVAVMTVSGTARIQEAPGGLFGRSTSGDIIAGTVSGGVKLRSVSGDVRVRLEDPLRSAEISSSSGDILIRLAPTVGCELDLKTSSGSLDVFIPLDSERVSRRSVTGVVRGGATPVYLRTSSGNIDVRNGG